MKRHLKITLVGALVVVLSGWAPASSGASPLLSGYGGPGQGSQAILGSTLLGGSSGGGGGGSSSPGGGEGSSPGGGEGSASGEGVSQSATPAGKGGGEPTSASQTGGRSNGASQVNRRAHSATPGSGDRSAGGAQPYAHVTVTQTSAGASGVLGLSYSGLLFALLALAAVMFVGLLTRGLGRASGTRWHVGS